MEHVQTSCAEHARSPANGESADDAAQALLRHDVAPNAFFNWAIADRAVILNANTLPPDFPVQFSPRSVMLLGPPALLDLDDRTVRAQRIEAMVTHHLVRGLLVAQPPELSAIPFVRPRWKYSGELKVQLPSILATQWPTLVADLLASTAMPTEDSAIAADRDIALTDTPGALGLLGRLGRSWQEANAAWFKANEAQISLSVAPDHVSPTRNAMDQLGMNQAINLQQLLVWLDVPDEVIVRLSLLAPQLAEGQPVTARWVNHVIAASNRRARDDEDADFPWVVNEREALGDSG